MYKNESNDSANEENYYKTLSEVVKNSYFIGSYQRGYRWDEDNVRELLEDIYEGKLVKDCVADEEKASDPNELIYEIKFKQKQSGEGIYCLQPLVVKKIGDQYSVIDGQQRLTTLFIILKALNNISKKEFPKNFYIKYQSREKSGDFLAKINENSQPDDIDAAYIQQSYNFAKKWFLDKNKEFMVHLDESNHECSTEMEPALASHMYNILMNETRFIWDEIDSGSKENEQKIFADRNTGKLELTDSELIKSLFMNPEYYGERRNDIRDRQTLISELWDIYENELHKYDFWLFLPLPLEEKKEFSKKTRIDAVFWMLAKRKKINIKIEENGLFKAIQDWIHKEREKVVIKNNDRIVNDPMAEVMYHCWREVCNLIDGIKELYENNEIYNLLSLYKKIEGESDDVLSLYLDTLDEVKSMRASVIKKKIKEKLFSDGISQTIKKERYPEGKIKNILIAHNVALINSTTPIERFSFKFFDEDREDKYQWEREHIYASNEAYIENASLDEKIEVLTSFSSKDSYKKYINYLYDLSNTETDSNGNEVQGIDALEIEYQNKYVNGNYVKSCFDNSQRRYDKDFDIWRCLKLREISEDLLKRIDVMKIIENIIQEKDRSEQIEKMEKFFQDSSYDDGKVLCFLRSDYLYWDKEIQNSVRQIKSSGKAPTHIEWHGYDVEVPSGFWDADEDDGPNHNNFKRNYYRALLREIFDNTGIISDYVNLENHGDRKTKIVTDANFCLMLSLLKGTNYRINELIYDFFKKGDSINSLNFNKGNMDDYKTFADFINDNSMGNMMLLPKEINGDKKYKSANFDGKRQRVTEMENIFLPIASSNVLMGKYNTLGSGIRQWLMEERLAYLKNMIEVMNKYYET